MKGYNNERNTILLCLTFLPGTSAWVLYVIKINTISKNIQDLIKL